MLPVSLNVRKIENSAALDNLRYISCCSTNSVPSRDVVIVDDVARAIHQGPSGPSGPSTGHPLTQELKQIWADAPRSAHLDAQSATHTGSRPSIAAGAAGFPVSFSEVLAPAGWAGCEYIESMNRTENRPALRYCGMLFIKCPLLYVFDSFTNETEKKRGTSSSAFFLGLPYVALSFLNGVAHCDTSDASKNVERSANVPRSFFS
jgi:hypothetical protein